MTLVADRVNAQHALGTYADPDTGAATAGGPLLVLGASGLTVDPAVRDDPRLLAAATGDPVQPQDGRNAAATPAAGSTSPTASCRRRSSASSASATSRCAAPAT